MFAAAAMVIDDDGRTYYEYPDAFTTSQLVFFPVLTEEELKLYQADEDLSKLEKVVNKGAK